MSDNGLELTQALPENLRRKVFDLEAVMLKDPNSVTGEALNELCPVTHYFAKGVYARAMFIPKGTVVVGKIHKYENLLILSQGELAFATDNGIERVRAPYTAVAKPGAKRCVLAIEDSVVTAVHGTDEKDVDKIEQIFIAQSEQEFLQFCDEQKRLEEFDMQQVQA